MNKRIRHLSAADYMKGNEMKNELKPCPFCGGEASIGKVTYPKDSETAKLNERHIGYFVNCIICGATCGHGLCYATEEKAVAEWNKRVAENKRLIGILGIDEPWSLLICLKQLIIAANHLLNDHNCDADGYERTEIAKKQAGMYVAKIEQILKETND